MDESLRKKCGGCADSVSDGCVNAFARIGVAKVHWECWSRCNLPCRFCYREVGRPLDTASARRLIEIIATSGADRIVFAGGDPSLRGDVVELIRHAKAVGLRIEVQTNAHELSDAFHNALLGEVDLVGLSLDSSDPKIHDEFRDRDGNFERVVRLLDDLRESKIPTVVRSIVSSKNCQSISAIGKRLKEYPNVRRWSLLEFTPIGAGFFHRGDYELSSETFEEVVFQAKEGVSGTFSVDVYRNADKKGTYALVTPDGRLYGTMQPSNGRYPIVGHTLASHLSDLADALGFDRDKHQKRYGNGL